MIHIELVNGNSYENNPNYGWNLNDPDDIEECLRETGRYSLWISPRRYINIETPNVCRIYQHA